MDRAGLGHHRQIIDLVSDDELDADAMAGAEFDLDAFLPNDPGNLDLTAFDDLLDFDSPPNAHSSVPSATPQNADLADDELVTEAACLQMVLDVLPDISVDHALGMIKEQTQDHSRTPAECERIIARLLEGDAYPKEQDEANNRKRKRSDSDSLDEFEKGDQDTDLPNYQHDALDLLRDEFLDIPVRHLTNVLREHKTLFKAYGILEEQLREYSRIRVPFNKIGKSRNKRGIEVRLVEAGSTLPKELHAAKKKTENEAIKRRKAEVAVRAEEENLRQAQMNGDMGECLCCFDDFPINRMTSCNGDTVHFFCLTCAKKYVESEMGSGRCRPVCFADTSCGGTFARSQLQQFLGEQSFERLENLQQQEDLAAAGLDFLSECPFCDFKAECLPVEIDKEFRCENTKCRKVSCRLCQKETHIPLSCEEAKKDEKITIRHVVEEAMSAALIRHCNRCKHPFVKEYGCNKMTCSHCRNVQCYVCSKDVRDYNHFSDGAHLPNAGCPLHDNIEDRHEQEVKKAADEAMAKVRAENPSMSEADLLVQVSDRVKRAEDARRGRAQVQHDQFPYHMQDGRLVDLHRLNPAPNPAIPAPPAPARYVPMQPFAEPNPVFPHLHPLPQFGYPQQAPIVFPAAPAYAPPQPGYALGFLPIQVPRFFGRPPRPADPVPAMAEDELFPPHELNALAHFPVVGHAAVAAADDPPRAPPRPVEGIPAFRARYREMMAAIGGGSVEDRAAARQQLLHLHHHEHAHNHDHNHNQNHYHNVEGGRNRVHGRAAFDARRRALELRQNIRAQRVAPAPAPAPAPPAPRAQPRRRPFRGYKSGEAQGTRDDADPQRAAALHAIEKATMEDGELMRVNLDDLPLGIQDRPAGQ